MPTTLITGAGRRLGAALAMDLARNGHFVILHYNASRAEAEQVEAGITARGAACGLIHADLSNRADTASLIARAIAQYGPIDALINNASSYQYDTITSLNDAAWDANVRTNLEAPAFLAKALHQANPSGPANIINILDFKVGNLNPDYLSYSAAKVGLAGLTRMLAIAFKGLIRVNAIAPGLTMRSGRQTDTQFERAWRMTPLGRGPQTHEITSAARYILETSSLNGQIIFLDGGASLRPRARDISVDPAALQNVLF